MPSGCARVRTTSMTCGWQSPATTMAWPRALTLRRASVIASAAAVASSSIEALATAMPVSSQTRVWKLTSASRRPWLISAWYGVYAVYQAGFSSTLRRMTGGVSVPW